MVARRRPQAAVPHHRLQAGQERHPGQSLDDRVRPESVGTHRARDLRRRREALHPAAARPEGRRRGDRRRQRRHSSGQRASAQEHPARDDAPQRGAQAGQGRPDCAQRGFVGAARGEGRRLRVGEDAVGRDSPHRDGLLRHRWPGRQHRPRERLDRQGRPQPLARLASAQPRRRHEPGRPSAWRRRGQDVGRAPSGVAVGIADQGLQDAQSQVDRQVHRPAQAEGAKGRRASVEHAASVQRERL